jgi:hypothetical protein
MDENTQLYYDVIADQIRMAKDRLTPEQFNTLVEELEDVLNPTEEVEEDEDA